MAKLGELGMQDLRARLMVDHTNKHSRRKRQGSVKSVTLHYNGPRVAGFGNVNSELKQVIEIDTPYHIRNIPSDSLAYHIVVLSDGQIYQTRDFDLQVYHCGNTESNESSIAVHLPLGGEQNATEVQWAATVRVFEALVEDYKLGGRYSVKGHREWTGVSTICPGPLLMARLNNWRNAAPVQGGLYRIKADIAGANVRQGPGRNFPVAWNGAAVMLPGEYLDADVLVDGECLDNECKWAHRRDHVGFVHMSLLEAVR
jgi:hypothetical protein